MPSTLGSAELKFAKRFVSFAEATPSEVKIAVRERNLSRKVFLAVVPTSSDWTAYYWTGKIEFRLKGNPVETWKVGFTMDPASGPDELNSGVSGVVIVPPYWIETYAAATALWPVVEPGTDEQMAIVYDTNTADKYHVHMKPVKFTGHFDEIAFVVTQVGTETGGETNGYLILGCQSDPIGD